MTRLEIQLAILLDTALSIGAGGSTGTLADKSIVRDGWGRPIIPGSQVKGKLRWAVEQIMRGMGQPIATPFDDPPDIPAIILERAPLEQKDIIHALFGSVTWRSPLRFANLPATVVADKQAAELRTQLSQVRSSVAINRQRGTAEDAMLLLQEATAEHMEFATARAISGDLRDLPGSATQYAALLWAGLKLTARWGGAKSRGLGWATTNITVRLNGDVIDERDLILSLRAILTTKEAC